MKVELGLCKGKKLYDKRDADAQRGRQTRDGPSHEGPDNRSERND